MPIQPCLESEGLCVRMQWEFQSNSRNKFFAWICVSDKYAVRFIPRENGIHSIDVKFNGSHVVGSPFKVRVGEPGQVESPALVTAYGPGLESGITGNPFPLTLISKLWNYIRFFPKKCFVLLPNIFYSSETELWRWTGKHQSLGSCRIKCQN